MKRTLIVNVNWLGDVLFSTPAIKALKKNFPRSYIACLIPPRCREILEDNPYLDEIIIYDEKGIHKGIFAKLRFIQQLKKKNFDTAFLFHRSFTRALLVYLAGIRERVGYCTKKRGFLLTQKVPCPLKDSLHRIDYFLNILRYDGVKIEDRSYDFFISPDARNHINSFLKQEGIKHGDFLVIINPGGNWSPKRWPEENFALLSDRLAEELKARVIISGGPQDIVLVNSIVNLAKIKPIVSCTRTNLKQLAALIEKADLLISGDSGPLHIAASLGKKTIALFGPTSPKITGPCPKNTHTIIQKNVGCLIPCYKVNCQDNRCMKAITVDDVLDAVRKSKN